MKLQIFVVRDSKANTFGNPFFLSSVGVAVRSLSDEINRQQDPTTLSNHPEDFELYHLGEYDPIPGRFELFPDPRSVTVCSQLKVNGSQR